jgi:diguanylate cyclase (GGDEF)-like protein
VLKDFPQMQVTEGSNEYAYSADTILASEFDKPLALSFKTSDIRMKIYLDNELIYSFGYTDNSVPFLKSPGTSWHIVELPALSGGRNLVIDFETPYKNYSGFIPYIQYGTEGECVAAYQNESIYAVFSILIILFGGLGAIVLYFFTRKNKNAMSKTFLYISSFAFFVSIWMLILSGSVQLFMGYPQVIYFLDYISLLLFPIPINLLIYNICLSNKRKGLIFFVWAYLILLVVNILLQVTGLADMYQLITFTLIIMALDMLYICYLVYIELRFEKNKNIKNLLIPVIIFIIGASVEMVLFYYNNMTSTSVALSYAVIAFLIIVIASAIKRYYNSILDLREAEYFEKLARMDLLTQLANRNKYEEMLTSHKQNEPLTAVLFDVNCLKYINDNYGHFAGDTAIKHSAECIRNAFSSKGECFRIGGDEFAVLVNSNDSLEKECKVFISLVKSWDEKVEFSFAVAFGIARFDPKEDKNAYDTVRRADFSMYNMKQEQKRRIMA